MGPSGLFRGAAGCVLIAGMAVAFALSFTALVYSGPLGIYLEEGIAFSLMGATLMAVVAVVFYSDRQMVAQPQDATAILLGAAAVSVAGRLGTGEATFATVAALVAISSMFAGLVCLLLGAARLATLARFVPYTVIAGFLAATGYLLVTGALGISLGTSVSFWTLPQVIGSHPMVLWAPWLGGGLAMACASRVWKSDLFLPTCFVTAAALFFAALALTGTSLEEARAAGFLLGPFEKGGFLDALSPDVLSRVAWTEIVRNAPTILAVAGLVVLGALLNTSGFEVVSAREIPLNRNIAATGAGNVAAASVGGLPGYLILAETILAQRLRLPPVLPSLAAALGCGLTLLYGAEVLSFVPAGLLALLVAYIGFDLLISWIWDARKTLSEREYLTLLLILLTAAMLGFLQAIAFGTLAAAAIFVLSYASTDVVRLRSTLASRRSSVERSDAAARTLTEEGDRTVVLELSGFVFFGTSDQLLNRARAELAATPPPRDLVIDFGRVTGLDASAAQSLTRIAERAEEVGTRLRFSGLRPEIADGIASALPQPDDGALSDPLDHVLERIEDDLLSDTGQGGAGSAEILSALKEIEATYFDRPDVVTRRRIAADEELLAAGGTSNEVYILVSGNLRAEIETAPGKRLRVAAFRANALVGEIAYYAGSGRTAWIVADTDSEVIRLDLEKLEDDPNPAIARFHKAAAAILARRVMRMTRLTRDAGL